MVVTGRRLPGEVGPAKGQVRSKLFGACLQKIVDGFVAQYYVASDPHRLQHAIPPDHNRAITFDIQGILIRRDVRYNVWIEAKGYDRDNNLTDKYAEFVLDATLAKLHIPQMKHDQFWFVSSAPFGQNLGVELTSPKWIRQTLLRRSKDDDDNFLPSEFENLTNNVLFEFIARSIKVLLLTKDLMAATGLRLVAQPGDSLWDMTKELYPNNDFPGYAKYLQTVEKLNNIPDANVIQQNKPLDVPLLLWPEEELDEHTVDTQAGP